MQASRLLHHITQGCFYRRNVHNQKLRLLRTFAEPEVDLIEEDLRELLKLRHRKKDLFDAVLNLQQLNSGIETVWKPLENKLPNLISFVVEYAKTLSIQQV